MAHTRRVPTTDAGNRPRRSTVTELVPEAAFRLIAEAFEAQGLLRRGFRVLGCAQCGQTFIGSSRSIYCSASCKVTNHKQKPPQSRPGARQRQEATPTPLTALTPARKPAGRPDDDCPPDCPDRGTYTPAGSDGSYLTVFCARHDPAPPSFEPAPD